MIMGGVELIDRWHEIHKGQVTACFKDLLAVENKFECGPFSQIGSLYFKKDVSPELRRRPLLLDDSDRLPSEDSEMLQRMNGASKKYKVGPIVDRFWWRDGRETIGADWGPWPDIKSYLLAGAELERSWIMTYASARQSAGHRRQPSYNAEEHLKLLDLYSKVISDIEPPAGLCTPTL